VSLIQSRDGSDLAERFDEAAEYGADGVPVLEPQAPRPPAGPIARPTFAISPKALETCYPTKCSRDRPDLNPEAFPSRSVFPNKWLSRRPSSLLDAFHATGIEATGLSFLRSTDVLHRPLQLYIARIPRRRILCGWMRKPRSMRQHAGSGLIAINHPTQSNRNRLLELFAPEDRAPLRHHLTDVMLTYKLPLYEAHEPIQFVHFPVSGVASLVSTMADGSAAEVGVPGAGPRMEWKE
jgi:hypothetical protein